MFSEKGMLREDNHLPVVQVNSFPVRVIAWVKGSSVCVELVAED